MTVLRDGLRSDLRSEKTFDTAGGMRRRLVLNIIAFAVVLYTIFFFVSICRTSFGSTDIPNEYREPAGFDLTLSIINGKNPYSLSVLDEKIPGCVYQYGPLFSLIVAVLHFILPFVDLFVLHYAFALLCMLAAAVLAAIIAYENTETYLPAACVFLFTLACTWRYGYINAVPDTLGIAILMLIFFVETRKSIKGREYIEALLAVSLLYTKQYFIIIAGSLFFYKLITDIRACIRLSVSGLLMLILSVILVDRTCPLYFTYTLLIVHGVSGQSTPGTEPLFSGAGILASLTSQTVIPEAAGDALPPTGMAFEIRQLKSLISIFVFVFAGMAIGVARAFIEKTPRFDKSRFFVIHSAVAFAALIYLGQNDGAWLSYYLQLLMPSVIIYAFISMEKNVMEEGMPKHFRWAYMIGLIIMVMYTTGRMDSRLPYYEKSAEAKDTWKKAYEYCDAYASRGEVLYRAPLGMNALSSGRYLYDNGHEMAIHQAFLDEYEATRFYQRLFPYAGRLMRQHLSYRREMRRKVFAGDYSLVMTTETDGELVKISDLEAAGYIKTDTVSLDMGWGVYDVDFWVPASDDTLPDFVINGLQFSAQPVR